MKKLALILALLMAAAIFLTACPGDVRPPSKPNNSNTGNGSDPNDDSRYRFIDADGVERWKVQVEPFDWGGKVFNVLVRGDNSNGTYKDVDFSYDPAKDGESVNDAAYRRNIEIEEMFNITLKPILLSNGEHLAKVRNSVQSGDGAYDITFNTVRTNGTLSREGLLYNLMDFPNINLSEPWWDQNMIKSATIAGKIYTAAGDISVSYKNTVAILMFNKQMIVDLGLESPYNLIKRNEWTFDKVVEMSKVVWENLNEEGAPTIRSIIGIGGYGATLSQALSGCAVFLMEKNADDIPELVFYNERTLDAFAMITDCFYDRTLFYQYQAGYASGRSGRTKFINNELLFLWNEMYNVIEIRQMDNDFGILPSPKYNSEQSRYYQQLNFAESMILAIPINPNPDDLPYIGAVVSALATLGKNYLTPAYYETTIKGKITRDEESEELLDLIYDTLLFDNGRMYNIGGLSGRLNDIHSGYIRDLTSDFMAREAAILADLEKFVDDYLALDY